ncbi:FixH family protein [Marinimicrobium sp. C6131]|uniref:FixH family protein n=1 Tax=Marinimicrobium sp. C6131 TaxID=3022676 RepID=UPI00223D7C07|nr:FixH family protein [Marinimicrobium sp. C6131]UZJ44732.1 FixH family protein [Marinimicrobium sp. C6131]
MTDNTPEAPWYRQPWFWFVMSPLIVVVCVSLSFVTVSVFHADDRVVDNYYKQGRSINQSFEQEARARALNLKADVEFDPVTGEILLNLTGNGTLPNVLHLLIGHPVNADQDQRVLLQKVRDGRYRGDLTRALSHRRYLTLLPEHDATQMRSAEWLLRGEIHFDQRNRIELRPSDRSP